MVSCAEIDVIPGLKTRSLFFGYIDKRYCGKKSEKGVMAWYSCNL